MEKPGTIMYISFAFCLIYTVHMTPTIIIVNHIHCTYVPHVEPLK